MDSFDRTDVIEDVKNLRDKLAQIRSAAQVILAKAQEMERK